MDVAKWFLGLADFWQALIRAIIWVLFIFAPVPIFIWWERRLLSWMQDRIGPNRVGNITWSTRSKYVPGFLKGKKWKLFGLAQPVADGIKSFTKEDLAPSTSDKFVYFLAPALAVFPAFAIGAVIPWSAWRSLTPVANVDIGVLYILAISSLGVYGVVLAGYASNNKYSLMGGLRASAQLISYELSMGMSLGAIALGSGSLRPTDMLAAQEQPLYGVIPFLQNWYAFTPFGFVAMVVFFICMVAETNRAPFDLPEAESELVAGYNTEYSTKKWVMFMMGEYVNMFIFGSVIMTVFLGGYNLLPVNWDYLAHQNWPGAGICEFIARLQYWLGFGVFFIKGFAVITAYIWVRATLPRLRYDQLMSFGWRWLLPLATCNLIVVALWLVSTKLAGDKSNSGVIGIALGWAAVVIAMLVLYVIYRQIRKNQAGDGKLEPRQVTLVDPNAASTQGAG
ncbi:MAG TPA: complex I subunit 1 family protein [Fimbriimonas sp.]|nr:complex I subunit 1 family protein [Fimbriimonas sp.]